MVFIAAPSVAEGRGIEPQPVTVPFFSKEGQAQPALPSVEVPQGIEPLTLGQSQLPLHLAQGLFGASVWNRTTVRKLTAYCSAIELQTHLEVPVGFAPTTAHL